MDWSNVEFYQYLAIICGVLVLLAIILSFLPLRRLKLPASILSAVTGIAAGFGAGVLAMNFFGYPKPPVPAGGEGGGPPGGAMMGGGGGMRGGGPGGGGMRGGGPGAGGSGMRGGGGRGGPMAGGPAGASSRAQLVDLIAKLDLLTAKPLELNLTEEQKNQIREKLKGLSEKDLLLEDEAKGTLDAILEIVKSDKETLAAAGFPPSPPRSMGPRPYSNPFQEKSNAEHLKSLEARLAPKGTPKS